MRCRLLGIAAAVALCLAAATAQASGEPVPETTAQTPAGRPSLPSLLSAADRERYLEIFAAQQDGDWRAADRLIGALENRLLMGHVLFQRYMHPTAYRSRFAELNTWMDAYGDHPGAHRVYALAKRRQGKAASPRRPTAARLYLAGPSQETVPPPARPQRSREDARSVAVFEGRFSYEVRRRHPERAEQRYWAIERLGLLSPYEQAAALGDLSFLYFFEGNDAKALALALLSHEAAPERADTANWFGGLAAWRLGDMAAAYRLFAQLSVSPSAGDWQRSAGGFWAARAALLTGRPEAATQHLSAAAAYTETFYGLIARRQLGLDMPHDWSRPPISPAALADALAMPGVRRAVALAEVGESQLADEEMRLVLGRSDRALWPALTALAAELKLPASQLRLARALGERDLPATMRYPLPDWQPAGGFTVDRALLFALMRQESEFRTRAKSHAGASGLMQIMPSTASFISGDRSLRWKKSRLYEPEFNMALGQQYIEHLASLEVVEGNLFMIAAAYNAGPGNLSRWRRRTDYLNDPLLFIETLPARETRLYVERVMANLWLYRLQLGQETPSLDAIASNAWPVYERLDAEQALAGRPAHPAARVMADAD